VFYIDEKLIVNPNEEITGRFKLAPHQRNERDLLIDISYEFHGEHAASLVTHKYKMC
jgi:hypothetical protein